MLNQGLSWAVLAVAIRMCDHSKGEILGQGDWKESEERREQTNKTNLVKPSAWLGLGDASVCACEAIRTEWRGLGQIPGCPTHSWLMIQSWSTAQRTSRRGTPGMCACICACACVVPVCTGMWRRLMYPCACLQACSWTNTMCVCVRVRG